jgi:hypothetical protein
LACIFLIVLATGLSVFARVLGAMGRGLAGRSDVTPPEHGLKEKDIDPRLGPIIQMISQNWSRSGVTLDERSGGCSGGLD